MEARTITLQWVGPTEAVHSQGPRPLEFHDRQGKAHFFDPDFDEKGHVIYNVTEEFGRRLLGSQPDRFYLLSPDKVTVKVKSPGGMKSEFKVVQSINITKKPPNKPMKVSHPEPPKKGVEPVSIRTAQTVSPPPADLPPVVADDTSTTAANIPVQNTPNLGGFVPPADPNAPPVLKGKPKVTAD